MPLYPYRCTQCGYKFEKIQHFSAAPEKTCPQCGGALERLLTAPGLQFKGSGWYVSDYAAKSSSSAEAGKSESPASKAEPAEKKLAKETKPKAAPDSGSGAKSPAASTPADKPSTTKS